MNKKLIKGLLILVIAIVVIGSISSPIFAVSMDPADYAEGDDTAASQAAKSIAMGILGVVQVVGVSVAVIMLVVLAIKYLSAAPNDRAEIKKHAVVYVIGAIVLFASAGILQIIRGFAETIDDAASGKQEPPAHGNPTTVNTAPQDPGFKPVTQDD